MVEAVGCDGSDGSCGEAIQGEGGGGLGLGAKTRRINQDGVTFTAIEIEDPTKGQPEPKTTTIAREASKR